MQKKEIKKLINDAINSNKKILTKRHLGEALKKQDQKFKNLLDSALKRQDHKFGNALKKRDLKFKKLLDNALKRRDLKFKKLLDSALKRQDHKFGNALRRQDHKFGNALKRQDHKFNIALKRQDGKIEVLSHKIDRLAEEQHRQGILNEERDAKLDFVLEVVLDIQKSHKEFTRLQSNVDDHEIRIEALERTVKVTSTIAA